MKESEFLLAHLAGLQPIDLYISRGLSLLPELQKRYRGLLKRREKGEPLQYIIGSSQFMGLDFKLNRDVFIPRPETEILIEAILARQIPQSAFILDIGTGCGNIAVTLAAFLPQSRVLAIDRSESALKIAALNGRQHNVLDRVSFVQRDIFEGLDKKEEFDLIVSNPPYIRTGDLPALPPEVNYEPPLALDGGKDGFFVLREIIRQADRYLKSGGWLVLEIGAGQSAGVRKMIARLGKFEGPEIIKDYSGIDRVVIARKHGKDCH